MTCRLPKIRAFTGFTFTSINFASDLFLKPQPVQEPEPGEKTGISRNNTTPGSIWLRQQTGSLERTGLAAPGGVD
jgi:hypothetical protein